MGKEMTSRRGVTSYTRHLAALSASRAARLVAFARFSRCPQAEHHDWSRSLDSRVC
jgi:hypothetical protein